jgi:hypothetical protein
MLRLANDILYCFLAAFFFVAFHFASRYSTTRIAGILTLIRWTQAGRVYYWQSQISPAMGWP